MTRKGYTQEELARKIGERTGHRPAQSTVSNWTRGAKIPSTKLLPAVLDVLDLSWGDIGVSLSSPSGPPGLAPPHRAGPGADGAARSASQHRLLSELEVVAIPRMARASAGNGYDNTDHPDIEGYDAYPLDEIRRLTHVNPNDLRAITVVGDSMEPEIVANSTVIYVPTQEVADYGLYVFAIDGTLLIKKIQRYAGGALEIIPLNETYSREMLLPVREADEPNTYRSEKTGLVSQFRVVGRVVFYMKAA
jgi:phage repressor protein C with HTH and peptisase S24 domain